MGSRAGIRLFHISIFGKPGFGTPVFHTQQRYFILSFLRYSTNAVAPGPIDTPLLNAAPEEYGEIGERLKQGMIAATSMRRIGQPEEVAAAIAFLASDDASFVTGQTINVSGGLSMA